ncbi:MAG TPA: hypothetical protein DCZ03_08790 [Gammaproteobacteria bacterium]|nr:hypothetical protein [Gammaproteobacteria bacterium]
MIQLLILILVGAAAVGFALTLLEDIGYILLSYQGYMVETSLVVFLILLLAFFVLFYLMLRGSGLLIRAPKAAQNLVQAKRLERARKELAYGILALDEGEWLAAERALVKNVGNSENQILNYIAAARAAHEQGAVERRDQYLQQAEAEGADVVIALTKAELLLEQNQLDDAEHLLNEISEVAPKKSAVIKLLVKVHRANGHWNKIIELLPVLRKRDIYSAEELMRISTEAYCERLKAIADLDGIVGLQGLWETMPKEYRNSAEVILVYVSSLVKLKQHGRGAEVIEKFLKEKWDARLVYWYGLLPDVKEKRHLDNLEVWRAQHDLDWEVYLSLARVAVKQQLWGKAEHYLNLCLDRQPNAEAYWELSYVAEAQADGAKQQESLKKAMQLVAAEKWVLSR